MEEEQREILVEMELIDEPTEDVRKAISEEGIEELKSSIAKRGLLQAITLRPKNGRYEIKMGHRRWIAVKELGWPKIRAVIKDGSDEETRLDRVHENIHHEDMSPMEEAGAAALIMEREHKTVKDVARMFSKSESWVLGRLDLLGMPSYITEAVDVGALSIGAARELFGITDEEARKYYTEYAIKQGATQKLCQFWRGKWEVERTVNDPSAMGQGAQLLTPPPMEVTLPCVACEGQYPIVLLNHLRFCPKCTDLVLQGLAVARQEAIDAARAEKAEVV